MVFIREFLKIYLGQIWGYIYLTLGGVEVLKVIGTLSSSTGAENRVVFGR